MLWAIIGTAAITYFICGIIWESRHQTWWAAHMDEVRQQEKRWYGIGYEHGSTGKPKGTFTNF